MKKWIAGKVTEILGTEDDVVIELIFNLIEGPRYPDIKGLQIQLTGFLDKDTPSFCKELWKLFLSAQTSPQGVPKELLEAKKLELIQEKIEAEKAAEEARLRREEFERRDRGGRGRGRGGGGDSWRGGRRDDVEEFECRQPQVWV
ncbi:PWI domain-containing protein [Coniochaeta ligniaria NRRL 30616]|uniref:PWI domain-containing protein n=1 Tax=Coniochaeta ligniaria NRRL 30616 TaxID=1408157 RepID=A0A1J7K3L9_9PEZI|nr:PWI domain-containing protein [Coniochaeta ligniaria NRRL 30616]